MMCDMNKTMRYAVPKNFCTAILVGEIRDDGWLQHFQLRAGYQSRDVEEGREYGMYVGCDYVWEEVDDNKTPT